MDPIAKILGILLIASTIAAGLQQTPGTSTEAARRGDTYAVYSALMANPTTHNSDSKNPTFIIQARTVEGQPDPPCVTAPSAQAASWKEILDEFNARKGTPSTLERALAISRPYLLLNDDEVLQFQSARNRRLPENPGFQGATDLFSFGNVYFNRDRTIALTYIATYSGNQGGYRRWTVLEKSKDAGWKELSGWVRCSAQS